MGNEGGWGRERISLLGFVFKGCVLSTAVFKTMNRHTRREVALLYRFETITYVQTSIHHDTHIEGEGVHFWRVDLHLDHLIRGTG